MSQKFVFEELDDTTRDYLIAVRESEGAGAPGVFAPVSSSLAGCGCIAGPIIIAVTLMFTLTTWINVIYDDPIKVAFLQTAGLLVGGWLLFAALRSAGAKGSKKMAGHWVYVDPLHMYEAYREQVTVTPIDDVIEASFTHNYNNGAYQNSVVNILLGGNSVRAVTLNNEQRAEQMVVYLNYLAWARGPEGGERASLPPASLGGLAKYVAKNDAEPKDAENNINLNLVELDITEVPEQPTREGRAMPAFLPYIVIIAGGIAIFALMAYKVNPPLRDDAIYGAVSKPPVEPAFLRAYLIDERNTRHREDVLKLLGDEYNKVITTLHAAENPHPPLRDGMIKILESLKREPQPVVSLKVSEDPPQPGAQDRVNKLRDGVVGQLQGHADGHFTATGGILQELARIAPPVQPPPGMTFPNPRTPVGLQLIDFAQIPEDAKHAHFEITYKFVPVPGKPGFYEMITTVEIRTNLDAAPVETFTDERFVKEGGFDKAITDVTELLIRGLVSKQ
jgi:hypothetical protein